MKKIRFDDILVGVAVFDLIMALATIEISRDLSALFVLCACSIGISLFIRGSLDGK